MLVEKNTVERPASDMRRQDRSSMFLRPSDEESASVARMNPPARQPMKNDDAGSPVIIEPAHSNDHSEIMEVSMGISQAHEFLGSWQIIIIVSPPPVVVVRCHVGWASVNTLTKVCCASKTHATDTRAA
ncbi:hypothetical protein CsSME_00031659 [Camellia sinensis var. sinensis]